MGFLQSIKNEVRRTGRKIKAETKRAGKSFEGFTKQAGKDLTDNDWWNQTIDAGYETLTDPKALIKGVSTFGASFAKDYKDNWDKMSDEQKSAARADIESKQAAAAETTALDKQKKMAESKASSTAAQAKERARRISQGRRGLLYGSETGVTKSNTLGG